MKGKSQQVCEVFMGLSRMDVERDKESTQTEEGYVTK